MKTLRDMVLGAIMTFSAVFAVASYATVGNVPVSGQSYALQDSTWLLGLAGGSNFASQYGFIAVGTNQATALQLPANIYLLEVDTAGSGGATGVALPSCLQGTQIRILDNTAYTIDVYPSATNNPITAAQDTINNGTSTTITTYASKTFSCGKNGVWTS